jgi:hypothetical protein
MLNGKPAEGGCLGRSQGYRVFLTLSRRFCIAAASMGFVST